MAEVDVEGKLYHFLHNLFIIPNNSNAEYDNVFGCSEEFTSKQQILQ